MVRKYFIKYIIINCWLMAGLFSACTSDQLVEDPNLSTPGNLQLSFNCSELPSRVTSEGVTDFNENKIDRVDCFLYKTNDTKDSPAVYHFTVAGLAGQKTVTVSYKISDDVAKDLFGTDGTKCKIYVIANGPEQKNRSASINELKQQVISASFNTNQLQKLFVMDSDGTDDSDGYDVVTYDRAQKKMSGKVSLTRAASKIMLNITSVKDFVTENGVTWKSNPQGMLVYFHKGLNKSHIDTDAFQYTAQNDDYFDFADNQPVKYNAVKHNTSGVESTTYEQVVPFYSYASDWNDVSNKKNEPYLILVVPWQKQGTGAATEFKPCYYQIPINVIGKNLKRNQFYKINLSVSVLGDFEPLKPVELKPNYTILNWSTNMIPAKLDQFRYLVVEQTRVIVNNQNSVDIPFATSHPVVIENIKCTKKNLKEQVPSDMVIENGTNVTLRNDVHAVHYERKLDNNFNSSTFDFTPYTTTFTIRHEDNVNFKEEVTVIQYPAIFGTAYTNSDWNNGGKVNSDNGFVYVNGYQGDPYDKTPSDRDLFGTAKGFTNTSGSPNMYVFTVTSVSGTDYIIGDPREKKVSDLVDAKVVYNDNSKAKHKSAWATAPGVEGSGNRKLQHYYATDDSPATRNVIAPKFRIASAYAVLSTGKTGMNKLDALKKRCASYQEDGYPAGRWRLPTEAEFRFIMTIVNKGELPAIYIVGKDYWCAHGYATVNDANTSITMHYENTSGEQGHSTRCVYDEWYWGSEQIKDKGTFTWGDKERKLK